MCRDGIFDLDRSNHEREDALKIAGNLLFDIAHSIGKADAKEFHKKMGLKNPVEKPGLSIPPIPVGHLWTSSGIPSNCQ